MNMHTNVKKSVLFIVINNKPTLAPKQHFAWFPFMNHPLDTTKALEMIFPKHCALLSVQKGGGKDNSGYFVAAILGKCRGLLGVN